MSSSERWEVGPKFNFVVFPNGVRHQVYILLRLTDEPGIEDVRWLD